MPNAIGPEKLEDWLYLHLRDNSSQCMKEAKRIIDAYLAWMTAQRWPELLPDIEKGPFPDKKYGLLPGEWDMGAEMTRCAGSCGKVRPFRNFHVDREHVTGHVLICRYCGGQKHYGDPDILITCLACGENKRAEGNYYALPATYSGWGHKCIQCQRDGKKHQGKGDQRDLHPVQEG